ncbi:myelin-associated glycoprotein-like [Polypterus senegalus]|uniref:myelin-associated glycoprotein-like n=1 Tax=Polypterus senegalus TaxID=55291 RepID=UPI0019642FCD|nr:myelin-associated glycoprotein-like [Polypterus senegalus]XP_039626580.1 myelin-associated glycoprotein-like [Polypterus senegalus]XP_039626581.1 myelin-associated glycoprotein-like [Polypterus senegalus]
MPELARVGPLILWLLQGALCKDSWISLPKNMEALDGSCVVIPCTFGPTKALGRDQIGVWRSNDPWKGNEVFRKGTTHGVWANVRVTIGDVRAGNCSTRLDRVGPQQGGTYYFRTEGQYSYTFGHNALNITVQDKPLITPFVPVKEGTVTYLSCSAPSSCPRDPPVLAWSDTLKGAKMETSKEESRIQVVLRFNASHVHHNKTVTCRASRRRQRWTNTVTLNVTYSPRRTSISGHRVHNVTEGDAVTLSCTSNANPPSSYTWYHVTGSSVTQRGSGQSLPLHNVTLSDGGLYYCEARNKHGGENSTAVTIDVQLSTPPVAPLPQVHPLTLVLVSVLCLLLLLLLLWCSIRNIKINKRAHHTAGRPYRSHQTEQEKNKRGERREAQCASPGGEDVCYAAVDFSKTKSNKKSEEDYVNSNVLRNWTNEVVVYASIKH